MREPSPQRRELLGDQRRPGVYVKCDEKRFGEEQVVMSDGS